MTAAKTRTEEFVPDVDPSESPEGWNWDTIVEGAPAKVIFDTIGDVFVGQKIGKQHIDREPSADGTDQSFDQWLFRARDGERYAVPTSYALEEGLKDIDDGTWVRLTYLKEIPTSRKQNPMKDFKVDVRK